MSYKKITDLVAENFRKSNLYDWQTSFNRISGLNEIHFFDEDQKKYALMVTYACITETGISLNINNIDNFISNLWKDNLRLRYICDYTENDYSLGLVSPSLKKDLKDFILSLKMQEKEAITTEVDNLFRHPARFVSPKETSHEPRSVFSTSTSRGMNGRLVSDDTEYLNKINY